MRYNHWKYLRDGIALGAYALALAVLIGPWLDLAVRLLSQDIVLGGKPLVALICASLIVISQIVKARLKGIWAYLSLFGSLTLLAVVAIILGVPVYLAIPLILALFFAGTRFVLYDSSLEFTHDWGIVIVLLIVSGMLGVRWGMLFGLGEIAVFFACSLVLGILFHNKRLESEGVVVDYRGLTKAIALFGLLAGIISLLVGTLFSPGVLQSILSAVGAVYSFIVDVFLFVVVKPIAWLLSPLFNWAEQFEGEMEWQMPETERMAMDELQSAGQAAETAAVSQTVAEFMGIVIAVLISFFIIRALLRSWHQRSGGRDQDERESVFSQEEMLAGVKNRLASLLHPFTEGRLFSRVGEKDPIGQIRALYTKFVLRRQKTHPYGISTTPAEYKTQLLVPSDSEQAGEVNLDSAAIKTLTHLYEAARYGEQADQQSVSQAQQALGNIRKRIR